MHKKKILIVNCYFDDTRTPVPRPNNTLQAMGPVYLAGAFSRDRCKIRLYNEQFSGPLEDEALLSWPDMLVLTGLTASLDRMLQLTAYVRTKNPSAVVAAGGPPVRALPSYTKRFFDYRCLGDIEELRDVAADALGKDYVAEQMDPRFDLAYWIRNVGHVESSRNCNFRCSFCSLTGERGRYRTYGADELRRQIQSSGKKDYYLLIDNNFYGHSRSSFLERLGALREMWKEGWFKGWGALVTADFFRDESNLPLAREAGCAALFSGVESFDFAWLSRFNKRQNTLAPQAEVIRRCLDSGVLFLYGLMLDVVNRPISHLRGELELILNTPEITLPSFISLPIPLLGTPYFHDCLVGGVLLPHTRLRDYDGTTLVACPLEPIEEVCEFVRGMFSLRGYRALALRHGLQFLRHHRSNLSRYQMAAALNNIGLLLAHSFVTGRGLGRSLGMSGFRRTHVSGTERLDRVYRPAFTVKPRFDRYFRPTRVTDGSGRLVDELAEDLQDRPAFG